MTENELHKTMILASGYFLSNPLPEEWDDMSDKELNVFLRKNVWQPLEHIDIDELWELIESLSDDMQRLLNEGIWKIKDWHAEFNDIKL